MPNARQDVVVRLAPTAACDPERHDIRAVELAAEGRFPDEIAADFGVARETLYRWARTHPTFAAAMAKARTACMAWWAEEGRRHIGRRGSDAKTWAFIVTRRFPEVWSEPAAERERLQPDLEVDDEGGDTETPRVTLNPPGPPPRDRAEILAEIAKLQARAKDR